MSVAVCSLARHVDDLECFYHLFLPGGWRSVQGKKTFFFLIPQLCLKCVCTSSFKKTHLFFECQPLIYCWAWRLENCFTLFGHFGQTSELDITSKMKVVTPPLRDLFPQTARPSALLSNHLFTLRAKLLESAFFLSPLARWDRLIVIVAFV